MRLVWWKVRAASFPFNGWPALFRAADVLADSELTWQGLETLSVPFVGDADVPKPKTLPNTD
jgi:hypothetical protein